MRLSAFLPALFFCLCAPIRLQAQDPGAQQDAEAAREKLLKAADQLDNIQANSESTKMSVDGMKADVTKLQGDVARLQTDNAALRQQLADLQAAFAQAQEDDRKKEKVLLDSVAGMIATGKGSGAAKPHVKKDAPIPEENPATAARAKPADAESNTAKTAADLAPPPDPNSSDASAKNAAGPADSAPVKPQKGYYHVVASGETITLICVAYQQKGVNVSVAEIQKANGLTDKSILKVGQKLFIPKPGT